MNPDGPLFQNAARQSRLVEIAQSARHSAIVALVQSVASFMGRVSRNSFVYRWLTTEPEPDVIVIDLTETWSVGPLIRVLDGLLERSGPFWTSARSKRALERIDMLTQRLVAGSVALHVLARLLAPPSETESGEEQP
jgi:hypothetical protein